MNEPFTAIKITDTVYWVGAVDWALRDFHGYSTDRGTTYNAYLVLADKPVLVDTVKAPFLDEMMSRIASVIPPEKVEYIVSNHAEMDHSGCLIPAIERIKPANVFASAPGVKALDAHFHHKHEITAVKEGETLSLGNRTLSFIMTKMVHWPDSMFTYLCEERLLFSQDGFGMHLASSERFADELDGNVLEHEAAKYYANILLPMSALIAKLLEKAAKIDIEIIAPDHGPIWRKDLGTMLGWYARWAEQKPAAKAVIVYDTMWGSTESMAKAIEDGLMAEGIQVRSMRLRENHRSDVALELLDAGALLVGSPTINNNIFPTVGDILVYLKGLRRKHLIGSAFGSYGWSGEAVKQLSDILSTMGVEPIGDPVSVEYVPGKEALVQCHGLGSRIGQELKRRYAG